MRTPPRDRRTQDRKAARIARINELSQLARTAWFSLLVYLVFVGVTLLGVEDADFFVPSRQTQLPLVGVEIPTASFFWTAPILGAALYTYLHLFLIKLWDAHADARTSDDDATHHWLVNDLALILQGDPVTKERPLARLAGLVTWVLVWAAGPIVLAYAWWRSMPAHNEWMTLLIAFFLGVTLFVGFTSWRAAVTRLQRPPRRRWTGWLRRPLALLAALILVVVSWTRTEGGLDRYADRLIDVAEANSSLAFFQPTDEAGTRKSADQVQDEWIARHLRFDGFVAATDLAGAQLSPMPEDWLPCDIAKREFRAAYREREGLDTMSGEAEAAFEDEWLRRRSAYLAAIGAVDLTAFDFRKADLTDSFAAGARFPSFPWKGANLSPEIFEGSRYFDDKTCRLKWEDVDFTSMGFADARLSGASLRRARLDGIKLDGAKLDGADLGDAGLEGASLLGADLTAADLRSANLKGASARGATFVGANLSQADLSGADFAGFSIRFGSLSIVLSKGADLRRAQLEGATMHRVLLAGADLRGVTGLTQAQLETAVGDATTLLPYPPSATGEKLYVWDCMKTSLQIAFLPVWGTNPFCRADQEPKKTGCPWPEDKDPPPSGNRLLGPGDCPAPG
jgi:uncharacterized protein YjbI with pentapeptide repeats